MPAPSSVVILAVFLILASLSELSAADLTSVTPRLVSADGGTKVTFVGSGFTAGMTARINHVALSSQKVLDAAHILGVTPALASGTYDADILGVLGNIVAQLPKAVEAAPPPGLTSIKPTEVLSDGSTEVTIVGSFLRDETVFKIGIHEIADPKGDARTRTGLAPALDQGEALGSRDLTAEDSRGPAALKGAVTYVLPPPRLSGIEERYLSTRTETEILVRGSNFTMGLLLFFDQGAGTPAVPVTITVFEGPTLLRGTAPPHARGTMDAVLRRSPTAAELDRLRKAVEYVAPWAPGPRQVEGTLVDGIGELTWVNPIRYRQIEVYRDGALAKTLPGDATSYEDDAAVPADHARYRIIGKLEDGFSGIANVHVAVMKCDPPADHGVAECGEKDFVLYGEHPPYGEGGGGSANSDQYHVASVDPASQAAYFTTVTAASLAKKTPNEVVTGFSLLMEAKKLRIQIYGAKLFNGPNLSLRVLIQSVSPSVDRVQELEVPDVFVGDDKGWMDFTYNTERPLPEKSDPPFPPADYRVTLYAVGGGVVQGFYSVASDESPDQILVPGIGCPPYPLVRVMDTTGRNSNPEILEINQYGDSQASYYPVQDGSGHYINPILATLEAETSDPDGDPIVGYKWKVKKGNEINSEVLSVTETASDTALLTFPDYGYYFVDLEARDNRCGKAEKTCLVKIYPPPPCFASGAARFTYPFPKPNGEYYVPDLPGGMDSFGGMVPVTFRAFVVDPGFCNDPPAGAQTQWVQFGLFPPEDFGAGANVPVQLNFGRGPAVLDACIPEGPGVCLQAADSNDQTAGRFWEATFQNMNWLPHLKYPNGNDVKVFRLKARGSTNNVLDKPNKESEWLPWSPIQVLDAAKAPIAGSERVNICPKPPYLNEPATYGTGIFESSSGKYIFKTDMAPPGAGSHQFDDTQSVEITGGELPPQSNGVGGVSQRGTLVMDKGVWTMPSFAGGVDATAFSGNVTGTRELLSGSGGGGEASGEGGEYGFDAETLSFDYCLRETLFQESFETMLFSAILYSGFVGPIPVNISISVSLGLMLLLETQIETHLSALDLQNPFYAHFWLLPKADICLAASISADILFGIISIEAGFDLITTFFMPFHLGADKTGLLGPDVGLSVTMTLTLWLRLCAFWGLLCIPDLAFDILDGYPLVTVGHPELAPAGCPGGGAFERVVTGRGGGIPPITLSNPDYQPTVAGSPSGDRQVVFGVFFYPGRLGFIVRRAGEDFRWPPEQMYFGGIYHDPYDGSASDPKVLFLDDATVLLAWTQNFSNEDPLLQGLDPNKERTPEEFNRIMGRSEIVYRIGHLLVNPDGPNDSFLWDAPVRLTDDTEATGLRGDGKVDLAFVRTQGAVWATWVRYETADVMDTASRKIQMRETSIYAQKIVNGALTGGRIQVSGTDKQIDIEPVIAAASDDSSVSIVWINDPLHEDLVTSNRGRSILCSRLQGDTWSAPVQVLDEVSRSTIPGVLEPSIALKYGSYGMVAFTALPLNADEKDVGIQNTRVIYTVRLLNGQWEPPVLVYKKCNTPLYAHWPKIQVPEPFQENPFKPDFTIVMQEVGPYGTRLGAGNAVAMTYDGASWSQPINLTPDGRVHQSIAATLTRGEVVVVHQSPAVASTLVGQQGGGGAAAGALFEDFMAQAVPAVADPAISYCRISDPYAGPGAKIKAKVAVKNHGFTNTPVDEDGQSALDLKVFHVQPDGKKDDVLHWRLPVLKAGAEASMDLDLTMPRRPVKISFEVDPVPGELDPQDNVRIRSLGAQPPENLEWRFLWSQKDGEAVLLRWKNAGIYDRILIYRDGIMVTEIPGSATSHVDRGAGLLNQPGLLGAHDYAVRAVRGNSRSVPATCKFVKPTGTPFRRGDANADGDANITDAIATLGFLFLGDPKRLGCEKSADVNNDDYVNITDVVYFLGFLYIGGEAPKSPYWACGIDETSDILTCDSFPTCVSGTRT